MQAPLNNGRIHPIPRISFNGVVAVKKLTQKITFLDVFQGWIKTFVSFPSIFTPPTSAGCFPNCIRFVDMNPKYFYILLSVELSGL